MIAAGRLSFDPAIDPTLLGVIAAVSAVAFAVYVWRGGGAPVSRGIGVALVLLGLAQPMWVRERREPTDDIAAIIVDQSESLAIAGRLEAARAAADALAAQLSQEPGLEVRVREVRSNADGTPLFAGLEEALADVPRERIAGTVLITDGQAADAPDDVRPLRPLGPVHALIVGDPDRGDRRLTLLSAPSFGVVDEPFEIQAQVDDAAAPGARVSVTAAIDGQAVRTVTVRVGEPFTVRLRTPRRGAAMVTLEAAPGPEEITLANNRAAFSLTGVRDRLRVLLITGEPHQGARVWRNLLKSDPAVDLVHFTILRPPEKQDFTPADELALIPFPTRQLFEDRLDEFDLIIFDRYRHREGVLESPYFFNIARRVEAGGALLITASDVDAGPESLYRTPLAAILPAQPTSEIIRRPYRPTPSAVGARHPVLRGLPDPQGWGRWTRLVAANAGAGQTLLTDGGGHPLLTIDRAGRGRVATFWTDQVWLWARGYDGGGPHGELLRRLIHWLMQEPELEDERLTLTPTEAGLTIERSTIGESPGEVTLTDPAGESRTVTLSQVEPGLWRALAPAPAQGLYQAEQNGLRAFAAVGPLNPREAARLDATDALVRPLVDATRGGVAFLGEDGRALPAVRRVDAGERPSGDDWIGFRRNGAYVVRSAVAEPLGPGWLWALLGLAIFMIGWRRETR